jgi:ABC-2 type transport system permease protein
MIMKLNIVSRLARKEFFGYINSPLAYTVVVPFLLLSVFLYTRTALVGGEANLRPYFELLPWFLLFLAPALSMKLLTDEQRSDTIELLLAHPISELEIVVGKFLGALAFFIVILFTTFGLPLSLIVYSRPDLGQMAGQYIGALFIGATFISVGIAASAYVKNAISSFLLGAAISFVLVIVGFDLVTQMLPLPFSRIASELSVLTHGESIARGLLDIRDVFYFLTITAIFLAITVFKLSERKTIERPREARKIKIALGLILVIGVVSNIILSSYPLRIDLTQGRLFTLSEGTKQTLRNLDDIVTITLYSSRQLPAQMQLVARDITDLLRDYEKLSRNVKFKTVYPDESPEGASGARQAGINEIQFSTLSSGRFEAQAGFLGLAIRFGDKTESIPFISDTSDLEYQLTRRIRKLSANKDRVVGIYRNGYFPSEMLNQLLSSQYKTETLTVNDKGKLKDLSALIVIDNGSQESTASALITDYLNQNGKVLLLASGVNVSPQSLSAQKSQSTIPRFLADYGITLNNDLVYDLQLAEILNFSDQNGRRYISQYPYWLRSLPVAGDFVPLSTVKSVSLGWPSSLTLTSKEGVKLKTLLTTGMNAGKTDNVFSISPQSVGALTPNSQKIPLSVLAERGDMRLVVVSSAMLADDQFLQNNSDNVAFLSNVVDYLAADKDLAAIPSKSSGRAVFEFKNPTDVLLMQYGNLLIPPLAVIVFAVSYLRRRRHLTKRVYEQ